MKYNPTLHKLSNGVTVILDPMDIETVAIKVLFTTGDRDELPHEYGITHFCEHMLCKGTSQLPNKKAIDDYMDYYGASRNAVTGNAYMALIGRVLAENVNILIDFFGDQLQDSLFEPDKIEIERNVICDERRRALDNPDRQFGDFISKHLFNYATFSFRGIGPVENIMSFTREQMLEFISRRFSAKNCIICLSGRLDNPDATLAHIEKRFSFLPTHDVSQNTEIHYTPAVAHNSLPDKNNVRLRILFPEIWPNTIENEYKRICVSRFKRFITKKLSDVLRQENGLVYGFGGSTAGNEVFSVNGFSTETSAQNLGTVVALIAKTAYQIYSHPDITFDDLDRFNRKDRLSDANWLESATARCDALVGEYRVHGILYDFYDAVRKYDSVTPADVIKYLRGFFDGPISIVTQGADFDGDLKQIWIDNFKE
ncbi:MAG: insulinase family protein [Alphaproteobacteria bacterium]|nr:insulinase family protein [Alphaproteobacteria bacterium]